MSEKPITLLDVKMAMRDSRFRNSLPAELNEDVRKYLENPGCACNMPIYRRVIKIAKTQLQSYFPNRAVSDPEEEDKLLMKNSFLVIDCHVKDLEAHLNRLGPGRKQITCSRYEDKVVVIVNELDLVYTP
jgi:hypothetical protein